MNDKKNIKYDMTIMRCLNAIFNSEYSMITNMIFVEIDKKMNRISFITLWLAWIFLFINYILSYLLNNIIIILIIILGLDLIVLYYNIYFEIIIPDKIKEIYNNGYWMRGCIIDGDLIINIDEFFLNSKDLEKHRDEVINRYLQENKRS